MASVQRPSTSSQPMAKVAPFAARSIQYLASPQGVGLTTSFVFHSIVLLIIGLVVLNSLPAEKLVARLDARLAQDHKNEPIPDQLPSITVVNPSEAAGGTNRPVDIVGATEEAADDIFLAESTSLKFEIAAFHGHPGPAKAVSSPMPKQAGLAGGKGKGNGLGDGIGNGAKFFGIAPSGRRIVYVVDCSGSMNSKYEHEVVKTRFNRVRLELVNSIGQMDVDSEFYVIFFNNEVISMPTEEMQLATKENKEKYLRWVATASAGGGPTDPREALYKALKLGPEVVYFLTDGEFHPRINRDLLALHQYHAKIHTFAFGTNLGEFVLKKLALRNGGEYLFVQ